MGDDTPSSVHRSQLIRISLLIAMIGGILAAGLVGFASRSSPPFEGTFDDAVRIMRSETGGNEWQEEEVFPELDPHVVRGVSWWEGNRDCHWFLGQMDKAGNLKVGDEAFNDPRSAYIVATSGTLFLSRTHCDTAVLNSSPVLSTFEHLSWYE